MMNKIFRLAAVTALLLVQASANAEDIDLFVGTPNSADLPNVLIIVDNTANWGSGNYPQPFGNEKAALINTFNALPTGPGGEAKFRVGVMFAAETGSPNNNVDGGYVRAAIRQMTTENKSIYGAFLNSIDSNNDKGNGGSSSLVMAEAHRYLTGGIPVAGNGKAKSDYTGNSYTGTTAQSREVYALPGNALSSFNGSPYNAPPSTGCNKTYIIYLSNGPSQDNTAVIGSSRALLQEAGGSTATIPLTPNGSQGNVIDEWARFLNVDQGVITYTIDVNPGTSSQGLGWTALLKSAADVGQGKYFAANSDSDGGQEILEAMNTILSEIQSVNSAFASATLPVSVNAQGTYVNQIFIGMFRPEQEPRWFGNLKQYQFVADVDAAGNIVGLKTGDKNGSPVVSPLTGFITPCAESFWSSADTYWPDGYLGNCLGSDVRSNSPDGEIVEKGGAAQKLRALSPASRKVLTCNGCALNAALPEFTATNSGLSADVVAWARGADSSITPERTGQTAANMRPSVHGDVVHSRPLAVDYGGDIGVVVFYGGNDGMLRAINGNKADTAGNELWSFVAPEHFGKFNRLKTNTPIVNFPGVSAEITPTPTAKDYFFDGPIGAYSSGTTKWIYPTMRRGGRSVYAFDVSTPATPVLKWKRDENSTGFADIGQTWSDPKVVKVAGYPSLADATKSPVIIMGGGYDTCEDNDAAPNTTCTSPKGNRIYVLNADTGELVRTFNTERSVPASITVRDTDGDGMADIAYAVDTGANIYRISIGKGEPSDWSMTRIAALGCTTTASCDRKFLQAPEVILTAEYNAVLVGSGNRERPLMANNATLVDNAFFMIKDVASVISPTLITTSTTTSTGAKALVEIDPSLEPTKAQLAELDKPTNKGWYLAFGSGVHDKEQVVTSAVVIAGVAYFSTHTPSVPMTCRANLGLARGYAVNFRNSSSRDTYKPDAIVEVNDDGTLFVTFPDGTTATYQAGTTVVTNPDGTVIVTDPNGLVFVRFADGTTANYPAGTTVGTNADGTVIVTYADGTVLEIDPPDTNANRYSVFAGGGLAPSPVGGIVEIAVDKPDGTTRLEKVAFLIGGKPPAGEVCSGICGSKVEIPVSPVRSRIYWYIQR